MCLAIPMRVKKIENGFGIADYRGVERKVSTLLVEDIKEGDYVLIHAGFAIAKVEKEEAEDTIALIEEYSFDA